MTGEAGLVSVGMPFWNAESFLGEAIDSVLAQTWPDWELLLVDDGSTDASTVIAKEYASRYRDRIRYLQHGDGKNHGISASRNVALEAARGEYIGFLDADDVWLPNKLAEQTSVLGANPGAAMVYGHYRYWYSWTGRTDDNNRDFMPSLGVVTGVLMPPRFLLTRLYPIGEGRTPSMSDLLMSRDVALRVGGFEEAFRGLYEDHAFLVKVYLIGSVVARQECWSKYRIHPQSCLSTGNNPGNYTAVRSRFFTWFESYLQSQGVNDPHIWSAVQEARGRRRTLEEHYGGWLFRVAAGNEAALVVPPDSVDTLRVAIGACATAPAWDIQLNRPRIRVQKGRDYKLHYRARADGPRTVGVGVAIACEPWSNLGLYHTVTVTPEWQTFEHEFQAAADEANARIHFDVGNSSVSVEFSDVALRTPDGAAAPGLNFGDLRRVEPVSRNWGFDGGLPVDRYYIEQFLAKHAPDVRGRVLEIKDNAYTRKYGAERVTQSDVLDVLPSNPDATIIADLTAASNVPSDAFDCVILTQTLQLIFDVKRALQTVHRILRPGGVLLATIPGITQTEEYSSGVAWYWTFTTVSARRLMEQTFGNSGVSIESYGNVLAAVSFLHGVPAEELTEDEMEHHDKAYDLIITVRAVKGAASYDR